MCDGKKQYWIQSWNRGSQMDSWGHPAARIIQICGEEAHINYNNIYNIYIFIYIYMYMNYDK